MSAVYDGRMSRLLAVCVVHQLLPDAGTAGVTGIDKRPVARGVKIGPFGARGDVQVNRKHHGGLDKALYAYAQEDAEHWERELGREVPPGFFGENLRTEGIDVNAARIGEVWQIGERVQVAVTMPRTPCQTFSRWLGGSDERGWVKRFAAERRLGPYLRVLRGGVVKPGDEIVVTPAPAGSPGLLDGFVAPA